MTPQFNSIYTQALMSAGLTEEQAHLYEVLLQRGTRQAGQLPKVLGISRPYVYKILDELVEMGLVVKEEPPGKPAQFIPAHPLSIRELMRKRQEEMEIAKETVEGVITSLISDYTNIARVPGVRILAGGEGLSIVNADIRKDRQNVRFIRSTWNPSNHERNESNLKHIEASVALGIQTRIIGPLPDHVPFNELPLRDKSRLVERRILDPKAGEFPARILIYGNKVALTSYQDPIMTTLIENEAIAVTIGSMFELIWNSSKKTEDALRDAITSGT